MLNNDERITTNEENVLDILSDAWNAFCRLHADYKTDSDGTEFMQAIHAAQNIVLARSALRQIHRKSVCVRPLNYMLK